MEEKQAQLTYLRRERRKWALSQQELADIMGCSRDYYSRIEQGKRPPARHFGIACQLLFGLAPEEMFPDHHAEVEEHVLRRVYELVETIESVTGRDADRKRAFADQVLERAITRINAPAL